MVLVIFLCIKNQDIPDKECLLRNSFILKLASIKRPDLQYHSREAVQNAALLSISHAF